MWKSVETPPAALVLIAIVPRLIDVLVKDTAQTAVTVPLIVKVSVGLVASAANAEDPAPATSARAAAPEVGELHC
jgi:hypothetical protein